MDYHKLLFAAEVRKLAVDLQQMKRKEISEEYASAQETDRQDFLSAWDNEYPLSVFITLAHAQINAVLEQLETQEAEKSSARLNEALNNVLRV